jgi:hypothetical protein
MTHIYYDVTQMADTFTKYIFEHIPDQQFEVTDMGGVVVNAATDWRDIPLLGDIMKYFLHRFVSCPGLVTNAGADIFTNCDIHSPAELTGLLNLLLYTSHPEWEADLANSPVPQLRADMCYIVNQAGQSVFSMSADRQFCHFFTTFLHKELAPAMWILFGEDITPAANAARLAANGPGFPLGDGGGGGGGGGPMGAGVGGTGHGPQRVVISLSDDVEAKDRELAAANDNVGPDRVHAMQQNDRSRIVLEESANRGGSVADRLDWLGKNLDIDSDLDHAMVYRVVIANSLWGKGASADEFRLLSAQLGRNCALHYKERVKIGASSRPFSGPRNGAMLPKIKFSKIVPNPLGCSWGTPNDHSHHPEPPFGSI